MNRQFHPKSVNFIPFTKMSPAGVVSYWSSSASDGLNRSHVAAAQKYYGSNKLESHQKSWLSLAVRQFTSPFIYLLIAASVLAILLGQILDGVMISGFIFINAVLGFFQEYRSEQALKVLRKFLAMEITVVREGEEIIVDSETIVPGDIVMLNPGDIIPADLRLLESLHLSVDESILTGESIPVAKHHQPSPKLVKAIHQAKNIVFSGTSVISGQARGIVVAIGKQTYLGNIAKITDTTSHISTFEKGMAKFSRFVLYLVVLTLALVFIANYLIKGEGLDFTEFLIFSIAMAAAVVPEALPVVITFSLSRGALRLAKNKVVVKRLSAIEDLGSIQVLCTDKTGTITENKLTVYEIDGDTNIVLQSAYLASNRFSESLKSLDPFDVAIENAYKRAGLHAINSTRRISESPFNPVKRTNAVIVSQVSKCRLIVRGAPEVIFNQSNLSASELKRLDSKISSFGQKGMRVIAIAVKDVSPETDPSQTVTDLNFVGLIAFVDPLKKTTKEAVTNARLLGVAVKIITGDSPEVAGFVANKIGLITNPKSVITGEAFSKLSPLKKQLVVDEYFVFARVSPEIKHEIIEVLETKYEVGFLGEGINDAPALKAANVALVVKGASSIATEAADIVLTQKSLHVVVNGIKEGREVFANTVKYIKITLASNFGNFYAVALASLIIDFLPMLPIQLLLVNLLSDFPLISVATDNVSPQEVSKPESYDVKEFAFIATLMGTVSTVFDFIFFGLFVRFGASILQTNWFIGSILTEFAILYSLRSRRPFFTSTRPSTVMLTLTGCATAITLILPLTQFGQDVFQMTPPIIPHIISIFAVTIAYFLSTETVKLLYYRHFNRSVVE